LYSETEDTYTLSVAADQAKVYVGGVLVLDTVNSITSAALSLAASTLNALEVDYIEETGAASIVLSWEVGSGAAQVVPASVLFHKVTARQTPALNDGPQSVVVTSS
jgi:hypothetical protein